MSLTSKVVLEFFVAPSAPVSRKVDRTKYKEVEYRIHQH